MKLLTALFLLLFATMTALAIDKPRCQTVHRSMAARDRFRRQTGHPHGWKGHVVDHIIALACGGADDPTNMQWQTRDEAKAKDKVELECCVKH